VVIEMFLAAKIPGSGNCAERLGSGHSGFGFKILFNISGIFVYEKTAENVRASEVQITYTVTPEYFTVYF
jgi:hypothetical protein